MRLAWHSIVFAVCLSVVATACAAEREYDPRPLWEMLERGSFADLEAAVHRAQAAFEADTRDSIGLFWIYEIVCGSAHDPDKWVTRNPQSAAALTARGVRRYCLGAHSAPSTIAPEPPAGRLEEALTSLSTTIQRVLPFLRPDYFMKKHFTDADQDFRRALELNPRAFVAINYLMYMSRYSGDQAATRGWFDRGEAIAPRNMRLRIGYAETLTPSWGGRYEQVLAFAEESRAAGLTEREIGRLKAVVPLDRAELAALREDIQGRIDHYTDAIAVHESSSSLCARARLYRDLGKNELARADLERGIRVTSTVDYFCYHELAAHHKAEDKSARAVEMYTRALEIWPFDTAALNGRGYLYGTRLQRNEEAFADVLLAAQLRSAWAQRQVARLYLDGMGTEQDKKQALYWFERCIEHPRQTPDARAFCRTISYLMAGSRALEYVDLKGRFDSKVVIAVLVAAILALVLLRGRKGKKADSLMRSGRTVAHGLALRIPSFLILASAFYLAYYALFVPPDQYAGALLTAGMAFATGTFLCYHAFLVHLSYDEEHLYYVSPFAGAREIPWPDVIGIGYSRMLNLPFLRIRRIGRIWLSPAMRGFVEFTALLEKRGQLPAGPALSAGQPMEGSPGSLR